MRAQEAVRTKQKLSDVVGTYWKLGCAFPGTGDFYRRFPILSETVRCPACKFSGGIDLRRALHCMQDHKWEIEAVVAWLELWDYDQEDQGSEVDMSLRADPSQLYGEAQ
jgi:hypothetical protein